MSTVSHLVCFFFLIIIIIIIFFIEKASAFRFSFKINKEPITRSKWKNSKGRTNRRRNLQQRTQGQRRQIWRKEKEKKDIEKVSWPYSESLRSCSSRKGILEPIQSCTLVMSRANWAVRCVVTSPALIPTDALLNIVLFGKDTQ